MLTCVCRQTCQVNVGGRAKLFTRGEVAFFKECPPHFEVINGPDIEASIDLAIAGREELLASTVTVDELRTYIKDVYGRTLTTKDRGRLVDALIDARQRAVNL